MPETTDQQMQNKNSAPVKDEQNALVLAAEHSFGQLTRSDTTTGFAELALVLKELSSTERQETVRAMIELAQATNPVLVEKINEHELQLLQLQTSYRLRRGGGFAAFLIGFLLVGAIAVLGYQGNPTTMVVMSLFASAILAFGIGGALFTGQIVTVAEVAQSTAKVLRAMQGTKTTEDQENEK